MKMKPFPTVDVSKADAATAHEVDRICRETGFLAAVGHGVAKAVVQDTLGAAEAFFDLPVEEKMRVAMPFPGYPYGYSPFAKETLAASRGDETPPDLKESFSIGPESTWAARGWDPSQGFHTAPTLWPKAPRSLEPLFRSYFTEMGALASRILSLFAMALELPSDFFERAIDQHASALRALDYPALDRAPAPGQLRAGAHSDYGSLTVLLAEPGSRGLEILHPEGYWQPVPIEKSAFIVNIGDLMARWSNDRWVSTLHRCSCEGTEKRRRSIAFFHLPNWDAEIRVIGEEPKYPPVEAGAYLMEKFRSTVVRPS
ncbi:MAG TPA: 2-oxoglutarate and iron-dependent oxygenase domain-containing protein [Vicinamibacteria bacterium]|nr:2-oxoglutarate and iron-dependent oxygenase domain-containing protein [Vicinamibacteria bacterium]